MRHWSSLLAGAALTLAGNAPAQEPVAAPSHVVAFSGLDSGARSAPAGPGPLPVYSASVRVPGAAWLRLAFGEVVLSGDPAANGAVVRITSELDGAVQTLNAESLAQWRNTSAYFNGEAVRVELVSYPATGDSRVVISGATAGDPVFAGRSLCGNDDRVPSSEPGNARLLPDGCTGFLINDRNHTFLSAGHCGVGAATVAQFNVPLSQSNGTIVNPPPQHQYIVDAASVQFTDGGVGNDWTYFGCFPNSNTGLTPYQAQGQYYTLAPHPVVPAGQNLRITGYGIVTAPMPPTLSQTQQTAVGPYTGWGGTILYYTVDTTGGNSGSPVVNLPTGQVFGIHTNAGCTDSGGANQGTAIDCPGLVGALANPRGVCASGSGGGGGGANLFIACDASNNFGSLETGTGAFRSMAQVTPAIQGLAYDRNIDRFYGIDPSRNLYSIRPDTGAATYMGTVAGPPGPINGLGYDPDLRRLYGVAQSNGQLYLISTSAMIASPIGAPQGGNMGGVDFDHFGHVLYGLDDTASGTRLMRVDTNTGAWTFIGWLGAGATDCNGLAFNPNDHHLYTVNAANGQLLSINPSTGAAALAGPTGGVFGSGFGMAARELICNADFDHDGDAATDADIEAFFRALAGNICPACGSPDFNGDGDAGTDADIESFFRVLAGGPC
jgi:Trypsin-like peptidase domain